MAEVTALEMVRSLYDYHCSRMNTRASAGGRRWPGGLTGEFWRYRAGSIPERLVGFGATPGRMEFVHTVSDGYPALAGLTPR